MPAATALYSAAPTLALQQQETAWQVNYPALELDCQTATPRKHCCGFEQLGCGTEVLDYAAALPSVLP